MSEMPSAPEPPDFIKWLLWVWHHVVREGAVIRQAPGTFLLTVVIVIAIVYWIVDSRYADQIASKDATIAEKDASIQSYQAAMQFQDTRLAAYQEKSTELIDVGQARIKFIGISRVDVKGIYGFNVYLQNVGTSPTTAIIITKSAEIASSVFPDSVLDARFKTLQTLAVAQEGAPAMDQHQAGDMFFFTYQPPHIMPDQVNTDVVKGTKLMYAFVVVKYRDDEIPPGKWRVTEICQATTGNQASADCDAHNRIYLSD